MIILSARGRNTDRRRPLATLLLLLLLLIGVTVSLLLGGKDTSPHQVLAYLTGGQADPYLQAVIDTRVARIVMALLVGSGLAVAGVLIQAVTHNPLADPGLLGITAGASAAVVTVGLLSGSLVLAHTLWAGSAGAIISTLICYLVATRSTGSPVMTLLLTGAIISAIAVAYINIVILQFPFVFHHFRFWTVGSLAGRDLTFAAHIAPVIVSGLVISLLFHSAFDNLAFGDDIASSLGTNVMTTRAAGIILAACLAGVATAAAGPISFIGLITPHVVRALVGNNHGWLLPLSALGGGTLVLYSDMLARIVVRPEEIMVGIVTALLGAPLLLLAIRRTKAGV
ncbi:MAG: iron ABC transporter permease [Bowdeniella nasicola]|nr:iron ABC transporter permease [Bowdeniella nasicola]